MSLFERADWAGTDRTFIADRSDSPSVFCPSVATAAVTESDATQCRSAENLLGNPEDEAQQAIEDARGTTELSLRRAAETFSAAASELAALRKGYLAAHRHEAVELAFVIAGAILGRSFHDNPDDLALRVERAVDQLEEATPLRLQLAPEDHGVVLSGSASALTEMVGQLHIELSEDPQLQPGEFRLQAGAAESDGRLDTLLSRMREQLSRTAGGGEPT